MSHYDWSQFQIGMHFDHASPEEVFRAWATSGGLESFFIKAARFTACGDADDGRLARTSDETAQPGDSYVFDFVHDFHLEGTVLDVASPHRFEFTFGGPMRICIEIDTIADGRTRCVLTQHGIPTDEADRPFSHMNCRSCWIYFLMALKARLDHGIELRDLNPATADAVSVHFNR